MGLMAVSLTVLVIIFLILGYLYFSQRALNRSVKDAQPLWPVHKPDKEGDPSAIISKRTNALEERTARAPEGSARPAPVVSDVVSAPKKTAVKKPAAKTVAAAKTTAAKPVAKKEPVTPAIKKTEAKKPAAKKAATPKAAGPERLTKANGTADDLKKISGVGPKLEKTLNDLGFWHFSQIAKWKKADVAVVDSELTFKGRIERDNWIAQAKVLAKAK